jgi:hypothetical protein
MNATTFDSIAAAAATAIKSATGATVEVMLRTATDWTIIGPDADVHAARPVLAAAGMVMDATYFDLTPDADGDVITDRYDYWRKA